MDRGDSYSSSDNGRTNSGYNEDSFSSQNVGYSGRPVGQREPQQQQDFQSSSQFDSADPSNRSNNVPPPAGNMHQANGSGPASDTDGGNKRLHVSNIPFRFREPDLRDIFSVS